MKKLLVIVCVFTVVLFSSCDLSWLLGGDDSGGGILSWYEGDKNFGNFWAINTKTNKHYRVDADLLKSGTHCNVYVEKGCGITQTQAAEIANHFDNNIYPKMIENFSLKNFNFLGESFNNIMELADALTDEDGKLCILLLDIKDNYNPDSLFFADYSYVAGYFWNGNFFEDVDGSNSREMIYIDTYPSMWDSKGSKNNLNNISAAYGTLAHEMQHMMNFTTSIAIRSTFNQQGEITKIDTMDTWVDEGLSAAAEYVSSGNHSQERIEWFNKNGDGKGRVNLGNTFFVWGNYDNYAILDDYATVYLFFQWLRLQYGSAIVYSHIMSGSDYDYNAVVNAMSSYTNWDSLLSTWLAANYINTSSGPYGYGIDSVLSTVKVPAPISISQTVTLAPGEGVFSKTGNSSPNTSGQGQNIKNGYIVSNTLTSTFSSGSTLLTYNNNTNIKGASETGKTTGTPITANVTAADRSLMPEISGPYRIDAADIIGRDAFNKLPVIKKPQGAGKQD